MTTAEETTDIQSHWLRPAAWVVGMLAAGLVLYWGLSRSPQNAFDDAYITYRYADNFRQGLGLLYNPGEWVLGTTTPLYALLLGLLGLAVSDLELLGHWLGVLGWLAAALLTIPLFRQEKRPFAALIAPLLIAVQPTFYTSLGMETPLLAALMFGMALFWLRGNIKTAVLLAALLILTRHDSALWLLVIGLEVARRRYKRGLPWIEALPWREGLATILLTLPWFGYAWLRYGSPLPNSAAAKIGQNDLMPVEGQSPFALALLETIFESMPPPALVVLIALFLASIYLIVRRGRRFWWLLGWPALYTLFYTIIHVANFPWYFVPPVAVLFLVLALTLGSFLGDDKWAVRPSGSILLSKPIRYGAALICLALLLFIHASMTLGRQERIGYRPSYLLAADWLRENTPPDATVATIEIGAIGYYSERPILDTQGLISRDMTGHQLGWDDTLVYALNAHQPEFALALPGTAWEFVTAQWWFQQRYRPVEQFAEATLYGRVDPFQNPTIYPVSNNIQGILELDTLSLASLDLRPGRFLTASLSISVTQPSPPVRFTTYLVNGGTFERYAITDFDPFANLYPSEHWQAGDYLAIPFRMAVPVDLPWGAYHLELIVHNTEDDIPLINSGRSSETNLGLVRYGRPEEIANIDLTARSLDQSWSNGIVLRQLALPVTPLSPGESLPLQFRWDTAGQPSRDWTYFIHLVDGQGEIVSQLDQRPWNSRWPTPVWRINDPFWETAVLPLPPDLPPGSYSLRIGFYIFDERLPLAENTADFLLLPDVIPIQP